MSAVSHVVVAIEDEVTATVRDLATILDLDGEDGRDRLVSHFTIQEKSGANSLFLQSSSATSGNANIEILASGTRQYPPFNGKYDLSEYYVRVGADSQNFSVEYSYE